MAGMGENPRILYLVDYQLDYGAEMLLNGLYKVLGRDNLVIYPFLRRYRDGVDEGYELPDGRRGYTALPAQFIKLDLEEYEFDEVKAEILRGEFDYIVMASPRSYVLRSMEAIVKEFGGCPLPVVFNDFEDYPMIRWDIVNRYRPFCCFKRELLDTEENQKICEGFPLFPLPFSAPTDRLAEDVKYDDKDIDVFFAAGNTHPLRVEVVKALRELEKEHGVNFVGGLDPPTPLEGEIRYRVSYDEYQQLMARAKINITVRGFGYDTVRRWEVHCYSGLVISDKIPLMTPYPFEDRRHIVYWDDIEEFKELVLYYLDNPEEAAVIGLAGKQHCLKHHTTEGRARYFLEVVGKCFREQNI